MFLQRRRQEAEKTTSPNAPTDKDLASLVRRALDSETSHRDRIERRAAWIVATTGGLAAAIGVVIALIPKSDFKLPWAALTFLGVALISLLTSVTLGILTVTRWGHGEGVPHRTLRSLADGDIGDVAERIREFIKYDSMAALREREKNFKRGRTIAWAARAQILGIIALLVAAGSIVSEVPRK